MGAIQANDKRLFGKQTEDLLSKMLNAGSTAISEDTSPVSYGVVATTTALPGCTYLANVLTATVNGSIGSIDGVVMEVGSLILVKNQVSQLQNGVYEVTTLGDGSTAWVLTRSDSYDETTEVYPSQVNVLSGTVNIAKYFLQTTADPTIGTDPIVFVEKAAPIASTFISPLAFADVHTTTVLPNSPTYANGGVAGMPAQNATYTATTNGVFPTLQGVASFVGMVVLVKDQADAKKNGDYVLLNKGTAGAKWQLRRVNYSSAMLFPKLWEIQMGTDKGQFYQQDTKTLVNASIGSSGNIVFTQITNGLNARIQTVTTSATVTPNATTDDEVVITAQGGALTLANPSGTPTQGQAMIIRIKDDGTARAITYGSQYRAIGVTLATTTTISKTQYIGMIYNSTDTKWDCIGINQEA